MTATAFLIVSENGRVLGTRASERAASSVASRVGGTVAAREIAPGQRVGFTWQGWPKTGLVTGATGSSVTVKFALKSGTVTRTISIEKLEIKNLT